MLITDFRIAWLFPGEGSLSIPPTSKVRRSARFDELIELAQLFAGDDLATACSGGRGRIDELGPEVSHPIWTAALCERCDLMHARGQMPDVVLGHGFGELVALYAARVLSAEATMQLASLRGQLLSEVSDGSLLVVQGGNSLMLDELLGSITSGHASKAIGITQDRAVVAADQHGAESVLAAISQHTSVSQIAQSGPWYSPLAGAAAQQFSRIVERVAMVDPICDVLMSPTARIERSAVEIRATLSRQMACPARWMECIQLLADEGYQNYLDANALGRHKSPLLQIVPPTINSSVCGFSDVLSSDDDPFSVG
jgi:[acyl-carrier-protein] S-malonyltransferase